MLRCLFTGLAAILAGTAPGIAGDPVHPHGGHSLGTVDFSVSCSERARQQFNRAVALLHHMTYPQARTAFQQVAKTDPACAMAHWGIAMTLFQPLWPTRPDPGARRQGWEEVGKAEALQPPTARERLFVAAAAAFFRDPASPDYWLRIRRWEQAQEKIYQRIRTTPMRPRSRPWRSWPPRLPIPIHDRTPIGPPASSCVCTHAIRSIRARCTT